MSITPKVDAGSFLRTGYGLPPPTTMPRYTPPHAGKPVEAQTVQSHTKQLQETSNPESVIGQFLYILLIEIPNLLIVQPLKFLGAQVCKVAKWATPTLKEGITALAKAPKDALDATKHKYSDIYKEYERTNPALAAGLTALTGTAWVLGKILWGVAEVGTVALPIAGAIAGGVLGSVIFPGLGTAAGIGVGALVGALAGSFARLTLAVIARELCACSPCDKVEQGEASKFLEKEAGKSFMLVFGVFYIIGGILSSNSRY